MTEENIKEACEKILPEKICKEVEKVIKDRGIEITREPKTVIRPEPIFRDGKLDGGKIVVEVRF